MAVIIDLRGVMARVRDALLDDVKSTMIKEKENTCLMYMKIFICQNLIQIFAQTSLVYDETINVIVKTHKLR